MKLFKYRSLTNFNFVLDIILSERLHCASYDKLNDPFEGIFLSTIHMPMGSPEVLMVHGRTITKPMSVSDLPISHKTRVCSLSASLSDVRLWSHYADGHRGVAIEVDFLGMEDQVRKVEYISQLKEFGSTIATSPISEDVLRLKTNHWEYEEEYRIIGEQDYFPISGRISAVVCGLRISDLHQQLLLRAVSPEIPIFGTKLNETKVTIETNKILN